MQAMMGKVLSGPAREEGLRLRAKGEDQSGVEKGACYSGLRKPTLVA